MWYPETRLGRGNYVVWVCVCVESNNVSCLQSLTVCGFVWPHIFFVFCTVFRDREWHMISMKSRTSVVMISMNSRTSVFLCVGLSYCVRVGTVLSRNRSQNCTGCVVGPCLVVIRLCNRVNFSMLSAVCGSVLVGLFLKHEVHWRRWNYGQDWGQSSLCTAPASSGSLFRLAQSHWSRDRVASELWSPRALPQGSVTLLVQWHYIQSCIYRCQNIVCMSWWLWTSSYSLSIWF